MGLGWFGLSTFWLLPLVWQTVGRVLAGERRLFGRGSLRVWMGTMLVLGASATLESLTGVEGAAAGGAAGHAMAGMASGMLGWTGALLMMLAVFGMAAPMVFGETWRSLFLLRRPPRAEGDESGADARVPPRANARANARASARASARDNTRVDARVDPRPESRADTAMPQASPRDSIERWETTSPPGQSNGGWQASQPRHKGIEAVSARRQPAWQPPPRTRQSPPQPGEIWLHHAEAPGAVKPAQATSPAVTPAPKTTAPKTPAAAAPRAATPPAPTRPAPAAPAQARVETPSAPKPAAARATVVSSPFRNPQLGLRSAITTLPEAKAAPVVGQAASATAAVAVASAEAIAEAIPEEITQESAQESAQEIETIDDPIEAATEDALAAGSSHTPAEAETAVTMDAIREEAMVLLAELRALAGRPVEEMTVVGVDEVVEAVAAVEPVEPVAAVEPVEAVEPPALEVESLAVDSEPVAEAADALEVVSDLADEAIQQALAASMADDTPIAQIEPVAEAPGENQDKTQADEQAEAQVEEPAEEQAEEQVAVVDANVFVQPTPKPRIVLQAVVGKTVALGAQAPAVSPVVSAHPVHPVAVAVPPAPPRIVDYRLPGASLLEAADENAEQVSEELLQQTGELIAQRLAEFKVPVSVVGASAGPVITRFEVDPAMGVRGAQVVGLMKDLARALGVTSIRVVETIPGKTCMGLELPNSKRQMIRLSEIVNGSAFQAHASKLVLAMGKDITGNPVVTDLARAPHLLVAGTTGSGKSVAVNAMILSMLYKATPEDVRLIMIDPKMLELSVYEGIPHLLAPVVTDMKQAAHALNWCVGEMEKRYRLMSALGVRNLAGYNQKIRAAEAAEQKVANPFSLTPDAPEPLSTLPLIVVVIDELADLMMVAGKKIEELIARLAQKARAAGIHLILATQRPSVDVITGLIKANIPTRVAFQVSSKIDSRTILDQMGAESLLGQGDMLFLPPGTGYPQRVHGAFVADEEVHRVVEHWKQFGEPDYDEAILAGDTPEAGGADLFGDGGDGEADPLYDEAAQFVLTSRRASISAVQRQLRIGYNRAARLIEQMEAAGLVSPMGRNGTREVIAPGPAD